MSTVQEHGKAEFDVLEDSAVFKPLQIDIYALNEAVHECLLFSICELIIKLVKIERELIDVVLGNLVLLDTVKAELRFKNAFFDGGGDEGVDVALDSLHDSFRINL